MSRGHLFLQRRWIDMRKADVPYCNYISLGYCCAVAMELERFGLRNASYPFDWCISEFEGVIEAIENHFERFTAYDLLAQCREYPRIYKNEKYKIKFYHDFDEYQTLQEQLKNIEGKYNRRITRFYEDIKKPTLFIRYISDEDAENPKRELAWIENNYERINTLVKSYNERNEILFIANQELISTKIKIYHVTKD